MKTTLLTECRNHANQRVGNVALKEELSEDALEPFVNSLREKGFRLNGEKSSGLKWRGFSSLRYRAL
jgi:hypothetical protein